MKGNKLKCLIPRSLSNPPSPLPGIKPAPLSIYRILVFVQVFLLFYTANTSLVHILALSLLDILMFEFSNIVLTVEVLDVLTAWIVHTVHFLRQRHTLLSICGPHPFSLLDVVLYIPILVDDSLYTICQLYPFSAKNVLSLLPTNGIFSLHMSALCGRHFISAGDNLSLMKTSFLCGQQS